MKSLRRQKKKPQFNSPSSFVNILNIIYMQYNPLIELVILNKLFQFKINLHNRQKSIRNTSHILFLRSFFS